MIRLSKQTDYGIVVMARMASGNRRELLSAREIAEDTRLPLPMVSKILKLLAREGLLDSQRGVKGGYRLARDAAKISVLEIIEVLEGRPTLTDCADGGARACELQPGCPTCAAMRRINDAFRETLSGIALNELFPEAPHAPGPVMASPAGRVLAGARH